MMDKRFEDILDACLDRITLKGESIEQCLESYPERAAELEPLLRAALSVKEVSSIEPRPEFRQATKARLLSALAAKEEKKERRRLPLWNWQRRWAVAVALILALFLAGGGTVMASSDSLPGDLLYPVKMATEKVQAFFTFGDEAKANLHMKFAERRVKEIESLAERARDIPESVLKVMGDETGRAIDLLERNESLKRELIAKLVGLTSNQKMMLARLTERVPPYTRLRLREALKRSEDAYDRAVILKGRIPNLENLRTIPSRSSYQPAKLGTSRVAGRTDSQYFIP
jgi:hypothetical protein